MSKTNIKYPCCHSDKLYKFGLNTQANQKYKTTSAMVTNCLKLIILNIQSAIKVHTYIILVNTMIIIIQ